MGLPPSLPWAPIELRLRSPDCTKNHWKQENLSGYPPAGRGVARRPQGRVGVEPSSGGGGRGGWSRGFPFPIWRSSQPTTCACAFIFVTEMLSQLVLDKYRYTPYWQKREMSSCDMNTFWGCFLSARFLQTNTDIWKTWLNVQDINLVFQYNFTQHIIEYDIKLNDWISQDLALKRFEQDICTFLI